MDQVPNILGFSVAVIAIFACILFSVYAERFFRGQRSIAAAFQHGKLGVAFNKDCYGKTPITEEVLRASYLQGAESQGYADGVNRKTIHTLKAEAAPTDTEYVDIYLKGYNKGVESQSKKRESMRNT